MVSFDRRTSKKRWWRREGNVDGGETRVAARVQFRGKIGMRMREEGAPELI
jgi:hypothetical protein